jgi:hypothetical protein
MYADALRVKFKDWFSYMVVTVVKIESRSFSLAEMQYFRTENTRSDYN